MLLVSHREKKARKIKFHPKVTIIQGENDTGKSSIIKSIQHTFGAKPHNIHKKWNDADVATLIHFKLDETKYSIYRHRNSFTLFDNNNHEIGTYSSVTLELAPILANIFDFRLKLSDREGYSVTPPPAYLMLPFYLDQDKGWIDTWNSFMNLGQFAFWKQRVSGYHFGIKPDKWYQLESQKKLFETSKDEPERQVKAISTIRDKTYNELSRVDFDIDIETFRKETNNLLEKCKILKVTENKYRTKITQFKTEKIRLDAQIEIVARTHDELSDDYKFSCSTHDDYIGCPTCGAHYNNSFSERFEIAKDTETCTDLLSSLKDDLMKVMKEIQLTETLFAYNKKNINQINEILSKKQGDVKLKDIIDTEGKKSLLNHLDTECKQYQQEIDTITSSINEIIEKMNKYDNPDHRKTILKEYAETLRKYTAELNVFSLSDNVYKNINASIKESGSDLPRAVLACFFSTLNAIEKNGNATFFPIVIDAPNQQEQDPENLSKILNFISKKRPKNRQLIVGLVDDAGVKFEGDVISLDKKYSVLLEEKYESVTNEIRHFESVNLAIKD